MNEAIAKQLADVLGSEVLHRNDEFRDDYYLVVYPCQDNRQIVFSDYYIYEFESSDALEQALAAPANEEYLFEDSSYVKKIRLE